MNNDYLIARTPSSFYDEGDDNYSGITAGASLPRYQPNVNNVEELHDMAEAAGLSFVDMVGVMMPMRADYSDDGSTISWGAGFQVPRVSNSLIARATRAPGEHITDYDINDFESLEQLGFPNYMFTSNTKEINLNQHTVFSKSSNGKPRYIKLAKPANGGAAYWKIKAADGKDGRLSVRQLNFFIVNGWKHDGRLEDLYEDYFVVNPYRTLRDGTQIELKGDGGYREWLKDKGLEDED